MGGPLGPTFSRLKPLPLFRCSIDPGLDHGAKHWQRNAAIREYSVMKLANVEIVAECLFGTLAQPLDLKAANQIGRCLSGYG